MRDRTSHALALEGGPPIRSSLLPYGQQHVDDDDIEAVVAVLRSEWLTTGPEVEAFEHAFADFVGTRHAVAVSSGTAALHASMHALGIAPGDEVIVSPMTFAATANSVVYQGATPVFADVDPKTLLLDPERVQDLVTPRTRAIAAVDYAGQPCDYRALRELADRHGLALLDDACHALGGSDDDGRPVGSLADVSTFSLHPVKNMTTGEGGVVATDDAQLAQRVRIFRNHGITTDHRQRAKEGSWSYEMVDLGFNYRLTDFQCALGGRQLSKLPGWIARRQQIARAYDDAFARVPAVTPLATRPLVSHAYHLYVVQLDLDQLACDRGGVFQALRAEGIGVNVHYMPVHLHPFYRERYQTAPGQCPVAEEAYRSILSLPIFPHMSDRDAEDVVSAVEKVIGAYRA